MKPTPFDALVMAEQAIAAGAKGVVFGRNVVEHSRPDRMVAALVRSSTKPRAPKSRTRNLRFRCDKRCFDRPAEGRESTVGLMKAVRFYGGDDLRVETLPIPVPAPGEVLIRVRAAGICGSDLLGYRRLGPWQHSASDPQESGHELAGEVVALGEGTAGPAVGSRVAVEPKHLHSCGACVQCIAGWPHLCSERGIVMGRPSQATDSRPSTPVQRRTLTLFLMGSRSRKPQLLIATLAPFTRLIAYDHRLVRTSS